MAKEVLLLELALKNSDSPEGDWQPSIGWRYHEKEKKWEAWWASPWESPFQGGNISGLPGGTLDNAMPGTWIAHPGEGIIVDAKEDVRTEVVRGASLTLMRLYVKTGEPNEKTELQRLG